MGPKALNFIHSFARKSLTKGQGSGITKIPGRMEAEAKASEIASTLVDAGLDFNKMDDFIKSEADVAKYLNILEAYKRERMKPIPADSPQGKQITEALFGKRGTVVDMQGNVIPEGSGIMGGKSIDDLMKSGDVTKGTVTKKSKKVTDRDMFRAANERFKVKEKPIDPTFDENMPFDSAAEKIAEIRMSNQNYVTDTISKINSMDPIDAMKEANKIIKREGPYKNLNEKQAKKILEDTEDHIFERNIKPKETDVPVDEGTADEVTKAYIDAVRKGKFKGTEDQFRDMIDRMMDEDFATGGRVGLKSGMTRRAFLKLMGGVAAGIGALKSGIIGAGKKGAAKKVVKEVIKTPPVRGKPEWFDALVNKVILEGDDVTKKLATKDREIVHTKKLNDQESVTVTQDLDDGAIRVEYDSPTNMGEEPVMMQYKPGMADETTGGKKPADRFDVVETEPQYVGGPEDADIEFVGESGGPDISFVESDLTNLKTYATGKGPTMKEFVKSKKRKQKVAKINDDSYEAAEYLGGKYGDGPDPTDYASGGRVGLFLGGGLTAGKGVLKQIFKNLGQQRDIPGSKVLQILNPKAYQKFLNDPRLYGKFDMESGLMASDKVKQMIKETEIARMDQLERLIGLVKTGRASEKNKQELIESAMKVGGVSKQEAEMLVDALSRSAGELRSPVPRGVSDEALLEMEQMYKNLKTKDRPANANGGIAYMLGE